jgi:hypothetical protein
MERRALVPIVLITWVAGALYCSGYERLASGISTWPGSLAWSAVAILPWLALFEWSKTQAGQGWGPARILMLLGLVAVASVAAESAIHLMQGKTPTVTPLLFLRRLPAIGASLLLILWSRAGRRLVEQRRAVANDLVTLAQSIDWVAAADNYIELHVNGRTMIRRMTMRDAERALAQHGFVRIHRRFLVNGSRIAGISEVDRRQSVRLTSGPELPVGRSFAPNLGQVFALRHFATK